MKKIAFHFHNDGVLGVDFNNIEEGNPGVGGTVYLAVIVPTLLAKRGNIEPVLLSNKECKVATILQNHECGDLTGALDYCRRDKDIEAIVIDAKRISIQQMTDYSDVKIILWANTFIGLGKLRKIANIPNVVRIINVSREQNDLYRDMRVFSKSTYIYNIFPTSEIIKYRTVAKPVKDRKHKVVYIASLLPPKGFHLLAKAWPEVLEQVPDAELFVIGNGKLYDQSKEMGHWGISTSKYESKFMPYLTSQGEIMPSVHFLGVMGMEKYEILTQCKVGVPNPSGYTETFGYTAVEMQAMGCHVTTKMCPGYIDTVFDRSCLYKNSRQLSTKIVELLKSSENQPSEVICWIESRFGKRSVIDRWECFLNEDFTKETTQAPINSNDLNFHNKKLKEFIRINTSDLLKKILLPIDLFYPSLNGGYRMKLIEIVLWLKQCLLGK